MQTTRTRTNTIGLRLMIGSCIAISSICVADHPTLGLQQEGAGAITTLTAITLPDGAGVTGFESQYLSNNEISDVDLAHYAEDGEQVHSVASMSNFSLNAAYGLTDNLTIGFNLPYVTRTGVREGAHPHDEEADHSDHDEHEADDHLADSGNPAGGIPEIRQLGDSRGIGDLTLYSQYRFVGDWRGRLHASALLGIKTPTGKTSVITDDGIPFEAEHQPGSGSWDLLTGLAVTRQWSKMSLDSNVLYAFAGDGSQDSNLGDVFNYNMALSYRLGHDDSDGAPGHHHSGPQNSWDIAVELNGEWRDYVTIAEQRQTHTGGNLVYLAPSVRFNNSKGWTAYASLGVPIVEKLNGVQSDPKFRLFIGIAAGLGDAR